MASIHRLEGKVAIVTGASRGIGKAIALRFAEEGARVVVGYQTRSADAEAVVASIRSDGGDAFAIAADVSRGVDVKSLVAATIERYGRIDILVNDAGVMIAKGVLETSEEDWDLTIDVNLKGPYLCSKAVAPIMIRQEGGTIVNMSSNSGLYHPSAMRFTEYVVSKAGSTG